MDNEELKTVDNQGLKQCKKCKEQINKKAKKCPRCGANQGMSAWALLIIIVVAIVVIVNLLGKSDISEGISNAIESQTQQEEQQPMVSFGEEGNITTEIEEKEPFLTKGEASVARAAGAVALALVL